MPSNLIERAKALLCMDPDMPEEIKQRLRELSEEQRGALHTLRNEIYDALGRLYQTIPQEQADPILIYFFTAAMKDKDEAA